MAEISRSPEALVAAAIGRHHQYPDGLVLYLGTMFAPSKDRGGEGKGFTHKRRRHRHDLVGELGALANRVRLRPTVRPGPMARATSCATSRGPICSELN